MARRLHIHFGEKMDVKNEFLLATKDRRIFPEA
jgi:hypothetical protein